MMELLRLKEVHRGIAFVAALVGYRCAYHYAAQWTIERSMKIAPHDGQLGLGVLAAGLMFGVPVALISFFLILYLLQNWEKRYTQKLDERERLESIKDSSS